jgi:xylulokinase
MRGQRSVLVLDVGTSSVKAVLFDHEGRVCDEREEAYATQSLAGGREEQNPRDWWSAAANAVRPLDLSGLECISLAGTMQSVIPIGRDGEPVRPAILYSDSRADGVFKELAPAFERLGAATLLGNHLNEFMSVFKIAWLRAHEPESYRRTGVFHSGAKDYLLFKLTGRHVTDATAATTVGLMDIRTREWSVQLAEAAGIPLALLPRIEAADAEVGTVNAAAASALGIRAGIPVVNGCGDAGAATVGAGVSRPGEAYVYLGTSAWVALVREVEALTLSHELYTLAHPTDGLAIRIGAMLCGGDGAAWFAGLAGETFESLELRLPAVDCAPPELIFLPYLKGERCPFLDTRVRGAFLGLDRGHGAADMYYAVLEGVALALRANLDALGAGGEEIRLIGGGALSSMWAQLIADVTARRVVVARTPTAATACGAFRIAAARSGMRFADGDWGRRVAPRTERAARSEARHQLFNELTRYAREWAQRR